VKNNGICCEFVDKIIPIKFDIWSKLTKQLNKVDRDMMKENNSKAKEKDTIVVYPVRY
jgi:hypothetical protein